MSNGFANYYSLKWKVVKQLTERIARVTKDSKIGYYVDNGLNKSVFVFGDAYGDWYTHEASRTSQEVVMTGKHIVGHYGDSNDTYRELSTALVNEAITEE